jgi:hypothetical protein
MRRISECLTRSDTAVEAPVTTDSGPEPRTCHHRACQPGPCRSLTPEQLAITDDDYAVARELVDGGFKSVSTKYRIVRRWKRALPRDLIDMILPEWRNHPVAVQLRDRMKYGGDIYLRVDRGQMSHVDERVLTLNQFRAFKKLGGGMA